MYPLRCGNIVYAKNPTASYYGQKGKIIARRNHPYPYRVQFDKLALWFKEDELTTTPPVRQERLL